DRGFTQLTLDGRTESEIVVPMTQNWNMISINVSPDEDFRDDDGDIDIRLMMAQLRVDEDNHHVILMKNERGNFYAPGANDFCNIPYWDLTEGYQVRVDEDLEATWVGAPIAFNMDIPIATGWNMIAYFPTYPLSMDSPEFYAIANIVDDVILMKNSSGQFAAPQVPFSMMPELIPGQGYQIKTSADVVLNYPEEENNNAALASDVSGNGHWTAPVSTGSNMSVLVSSVSGYEVGQGDQIAAFDASGRIVGVGTLDSDGRTGLAVWGNDPSTDAVEGLVDEELFDLRLWDSEREVEIGLDATVVTYGSGLTYGTDDFTVLDVSVESAVPGEFYLSSAYPNPFNAITKLTYGMPEAGYLTVSVYDISGRLVATLFDGAQIAGHHMAIWNGHGMSSGIYLIRMESSSFNSVRKVMLVK
ncbi:MAG: T9SS type A sorting domain-containing protein, partial [Candidatus Electryoneaceae bacterium]|nr:T9SS type A sorting domain-containing protein [Candidatus Electryoneaceae bacterium]